jgi:hypothetical protein
MLRCVLHAIDAPSRDRRVDGVREAVDAIGSRTDAIITRTPQRYACNPSENCVIGCIVFGNESNNCVAWAGSADRSKSSAVRPSHCSFVGISPVNNNQRMASGVGSPSPAGPLKVGSNSWHSGIV